MNYTGLILGICTLLIIGLGFVWVIKGEYYIGACMKLGVLILGILIVTATYFIPNFMLSALIGIVGASIVWGATEISQQTDRVKMGMFPDRSNKLCDKIRNKFLLRLLSMRK